MAAIATTPAIPNHATLTTTPHAAAPLRERIEEAANALRDHYQHHINIRFNSDGRSGGAWLQTNPVDHVGANAEVGLTCALLADGTLTPLVVQIAPAASLDGRSTPPPPAPFMRPRTSWVSTPSPTARGSPPR